MKQGKEDLKGTKYDWLTSEEKMSKNQKKRFRKFRNSSLRAARERARKDWKRCLSGALHCRLELMKKQPNSFKSVYGGSSMLSY